MLVAAAAALVAIGAALGSGSARQKTTAPVPVISGAQAISLQFERVVRAVEPSVVQIETSQGLGSGVIFDTAGHIVTNAHVIGTAKKFTVTLFDGTRLPATLVGSFPPEDIGVIDVNASGLQPAAWAQSSKLQVGAIVMAVGNPLGLRASVTQGIVSAVGRLGEE